MNLEQICQQCKADYEKRLAEKDREIEKLKQQPQQSETVTKLLDLLKPDIERSEKLIGNGERLQAVIATYRELRP